MKTRTTGARLPRGNERTTERGRSITKSNIPLIASPSLSSSLARVGVVRQIHYGRACFREKRSRTHPPTYTQIHANSLRELNSLAEREIERKPSRVSAHRYTHTHTHTHTDNGYRKRRNCRSGESRITSLAAMYIYSALLPLPSICKIARSFRARLPIFFRFSPA